MSKLRENKYFSWDSVDHTFEIYDTLEESKLRASELLEESKQMAIDDQEWNESVKGIYYGEIKGGVVEKPCDHGFADYELKSFNTPKHETVENWEIRTGESYPDDGPCWEYDECSEYRLSLYRSASKRIKYYGQGHCIVANHHGKPEIEG